jgi:hypothetical protein
MSAGKIVLQSCGTSYRIHRIRWHKIWDFKVCWVTLSCIAISELDVCTFSLNNIEIVILVAIDIHDVADCAVWILVMTR